jgi:CRP/FNR family transcriptional regulator, cyclic AMP receptor protein
VTIDLPKFLTASAPFRALSTYVSSALENKLEYFSLPKQTYVYEPDTATDFLFFLQKGLVKIGFRDAMGRDITRRIVAPGDLFGDMGIFQCEEQGEFAISMGAPIEYFAIRTADFVGLMRTHFELLQAASQHASQRLLHAERHLESLVMNDVRARVLAFLKQYATRLDHPLSLDTMLRHGLTQQDIAHIVAASRQTVAIILNELRDEKIIEFGRSAR